MRILLVCPHFPSSVAPGKIDRIFLYKYTQILRRQGHEVFIITTGHKASFETIEGMKVFRVPSYSIPKMRYPIPNFVKLMKTILDTIEKYQIDVLEFNNHTYLTALPLLFIRNKTKVPMALSVDGLVGVTWVSGNKIIDFIGLLYTFSIGKQLLKRADGLRLSYAALGRYMVQMGIPPDKLHVVYNSVDRQIFHPGYGRELKRNEFRIGPNETVVIYIGRLDPVKGVHYLLHAAKNLLGKKKDLRFLVVGDGSMRKTYQEMVSDFRENIIFTGIRHDVAQLLNAADIMVLPSLSEGCPNVVLEAGATAIPTIASNVGGVPELVLNGETGLIVPAKNVQKLQSATETLIDNPLMAQEMGQKALAHVVSNFNVEHISRLIEKYYSTIFSDDRHDWQTNHLSKKKD